MSFYFFGICFSPFFFIYLTIIDQLFLHNCKPFRVLFILNIKLKLKKLSNSLYDPLNVVNIAL